MKYLVVVYYQNKLFWDVLSSKQNVIYYLKNFSSLFKECNYDMKRIRELVQIFEIEPTYETVGFVIKRPTDAEIIVE